jgi:hypothetical protein
MTDQTFDITVEAVDETTTIHVKNAAGELLYADKERKLPLQIVLWGPGSDAFGIVESRQSARAVKRMQENDGKVSVAPLEDRRRDTAEDLAALTVRFVNFSYPPAGKAEGSALFAALYADPKLGFIAKQVSQTVSDWGKFKSASPAS